MPWEKADKGLERGPMIFTPGTMWKFYEQAVAGKV